MIQTLLDGQQEVGSPLGLVYCDRGLEPCDEFGRIAGRSGAGVLVIEGEDLHRVVALGQILQ